VASSLAQHYALATNRAIPGPLSSNEYIKVKKTPLSGHLISYRLQRLRRSKGQRRKFMSINDAGKLDDSEKTQTAIAVFLESTFPDKSQFEL